MTWRPSKALRNYILEGGSLKHALSNCFIKLYTGAQPAAAETAPSGTLLCTYSLASGAPTREVQSVGSVDLTGGASGSVDTITVNSIAILPASVPFTTSLAVTAQLVADAINNNPKNHLYESYVTATDVINIRGKRGLGTLPNAWTVASTVTTITKTDANMAGGVDAVNGMQWGDSAAGVLIKLASQTWSGVAGAAGTAGWFRIESAVNDAGGTDSTESIIRVDGAVATSGAEMNMTPTSIAAAATQTITAFTVTLPTA
jgi:hypothetical protein